MGDRVNRSHPSHPVRRSPIMLDRSNPVRPRCAPVAAASSTTTALLALAACFAHAPAARAADYLVDPAYAGANGAAFGSYAGAYNSITAALAAGGVPSGAA